MLHLRSKLLLYADDVVLYFSGDDLSSIIATLQHDLDKICQWSSSNCLSISVAKTKALLVGRKARISKLDTRDKLLVDGKQLEWVSSFTYLGLAIDETLSFNSAIELMHRKAAYKFRTLYLIRRNLTNYGAQIMAKSMIIPNLDYGTWLISSAHASAIKSLQLLQNKILKCALNVHRSTGTRMLHSLAGVLMVNDRIKYNQLSLIHHQVLNKTDLFKLSSPDQTPSDVTRTRSSDDTRIVTTRPNTEHFRKSLFYSGLTDWNALSPEFKNCTTLSIFKNKLRMYFLNSYVSQP